VASPKVKTYDLKPEMSAKEVAERVVATLATGTYPFVMCNFAPPDMVGHTGVYLVSLPSHSFAYSCHLMIIMNE
jgi:2,3-bisphosphoglycerate-independent phosphoglycerate mutase